MIVLALDTTSRHASVAVLRDAETQLEYNFTSSADLSATLIPSLEFVLRSLRLGLDDIGLFAAAVGPGLYTGVRVGLATLRGLLFGRRKPVVPVLTLHALAHKFADSERPVVPLIDARRGEVCLAAYRFRNQEMHELFPPRLLPVAGIAACVQSLEDPVFVGSGAETHRDELKRSFPESSLHYRSHFLATEIGRIAWLRRRRALAGAEKVEPFYVRPAEAEASANSASRRARPD